VTTAVLPPVAEAAQEHWAFFTDAMPFTLVEVDGQIVSEPRAGGAALVVQGDIDGVLRKGGRATLFAHAKSDVEKAWARKRDPVTGNPMPFMIDHHGQQIELVLVDVPEDMFELARVQGFGAHGWHAMANVNDPNIVRLPVAPDTTQAWDDVQHLYVEHALPFLQPDTKVMCHDWQVAGVASILNESGHHDSSFIIHSWMMSPDYLDATFSDEAREVALAAGQPDPDVRYAFLREWVMRSSRHDLVAISGREARTNYIQAVKWFARNDAAFVARNPSAEPFTHGTPLVSCIPVPGDDKNTEREVIRHRAAIEQRLRDYPPDIDLAVMVFRAEWYKQGPAAIAAKAQEIRLTSPPGGFTKTSGPRLALVTQKTREGAPGYGEHYDLEIKATADFHNWELNSDATINPTFAGLWRQMQADAVLEGREPTEAERQALFAEHGIEFIEVVDGKDRGKVIGTMARADTMLGASIADGYVLTLREIITVQRVCRELGVYAEGMRIPLAVAILGRAIGAHAHLEDGINRRALQTSDELIDLHRQRFVYDERTGERSAEPVQSMDAVLMARHPSHLSVNPSLTKAYMYLPPALWEAAAARPESKHLWKRDADGRLLDPLTPTERTIADHDAFALAMTMITATRTPDAERLAMAQQQHRLYEEYTPLFHMDQVLGEVGRCKELVTLLDEMLGDSQTRPQRESTASMLDGLLLTDEQQRLVEEFDRLLAVLELAESQRTPSLTAQEARDLLQSRLGLDEHETSTVQSLAAGSSNVFRYLPQEGSLDPGDRVSLGGTHGGVRSRRAVETRATLFRHLESIGVPDDCGALRPADAEDLLAPPEKWSDVELPSVDRLLERQRFVPERSSGLVL
jgi:hypothetical protein